MKKRNFILLLAFMTIQACGVKSPQRQAPPEKFEAQEEAVDETQTLPDPQVNILFVVDNSGSMKPYQEKMAANIEIFANEFFDSARLDYRIGVVPIYDSTLLNDKTLHPIYGPRKMNALGELVPLVGLEGQQEQNLYITRNTPNPKEVLKKTVMIGVQWGPEAEESFSPVLAVMDPVRNREKNKNFYIPEAHLAVIFLTDADDVTRGLSATDFYQKLLEQKGNDPSKVLIAAALPNLDLPSSKCERDGAGPNFAFPALLSISGGIRADLCSDNFGHDLASFGQRLAQQVATQKIRLSFTPDLPSLKVTYGLKEQKPSERQQLSREKLDYTFDPDANEVVISPHAKLERKENARIWVSAKPASLGNYKNGRLQDL